ncbi:acyl carrier protein [Collimonas sp.]|jgi:acyl carrier protein|uniref:acyl carrier protein n=1 Tax=Collimonas sp. TaxID=1963772 RepID=UPI002C5F32D2|nr:acyl carrier protein [Collimonas sp.]HWW07746.1 acyl carrier protein [Collimonas sp.]
MSAARTTAVGIRERVLAILADELTHPGEPLDVYVAISALGADSLDAIELTMEVESEFKISFSDDEWFTAEMTAMQIVERVVAKVAK